MKRAIQYAVLAGFLALVAGNVKADPVMLSYTLSGPDAFVATFDLAQLPAVTSSLSQFGFTVTPIDLVVDGHATSDTLFFYSENPFFMGIPVPGPAGGLGAFLMPVLSGPQLYSGSESAPDLLTGTFALTDFMTETADYTLTVSPVTASESSTLALFGTGLIGLALMRKRRMATANVTA